MSWHDKRRHVLFLWSSGYSMREIVDRTGVPYQTIRDRFRSLGILAGSQGGRYSQRYRFKVVGLFRGGLSMMAISKRLGIDHHTPARWLAEFGIDSKGPRDQTPTKRPGRIQKPQGIRLDAKARAMMEEILRERSSVGIRRTPKPTTSTGTSSISR